MSHPWCLISDTHYHKFSAFADVALSGLNSRLEIQLNATSLAVDRLRIAGGNRLVHAGDMFHVRGQMAPSVLNPVQSAYSGYIKKEVEVIAIAGNHDLEGRDSSSLTNAGRALEHAGVKIVDKQFAYYAEHNLLLFSWEPEPPRLLALMRAVAKKMGATAAKTDVIIHAPVNGVIMGIPDHGLDAQALGELGFKRVFAGHYHNHVDFGNGVYSIGALTHQTWSDVGSKAGFLMVYEDRVEHYETGAPKFVDALSAKDPDEFKNLIRGNYVRVQIDVEKLEEAEAYREELMSMGAAGVVVRPIKKAKEVKRETEIKAVSTLEESVTQFVNIRMPGDEAVSKLALEVLREIEEV